MKKYSWISQYTLFSLLIFILFSLLPISVFPCTIFNNLVSPQYQQTSFILCKGWIIESYMGWGGIGYITPDINTLRLLTVLLSLSGGAIVYYLYSKTAKK